MFKVGDKVMWVSTHSRKVCPNIRGVIVGTHSFAGEALPAYRVQWGDLQDTSYCNEANLVLDENGIERARKCLNLK